MSDNDELSLNIDDSDKKSEPGLVAKLKEKLSLKLLLIISAVMVLIIGGVAFFVLFTGSSHDAPEAEIPKEAVDGVPPAAPVVFFDDIVKLNVVEIKLGDLGGEKVFTVGVDCKIDHQDVRAELQEKDADAAEIISVLLKSKTFAELQGADGKILLKNEIIKHLNEILETGRVMNLFFYEYLIL